MNQVAQQTEILRIPRDFYETTKGMTRAMFDVLCEHGKAEIINEQE